MATLAATNWRVVGNIRGIAEVWGVAQAVGGRIAANMLR